METRTYTEKSNARRAARAAGVDPNLVFATEDGFTFTPPEETNGAGEFTPATFNGPAIIDAAQQNGSLGTHDPVDTTAPTVDDAIPAFCRISPEERKAAWERNPPKATAIKETTSVAKTSKRKSGKPKTEKGDKNGTLLAMLKKGATVDELTKALGWLPHTLRARISRLNKPKSKGGEGLKIERERVDGVTSYRIVS